MSLAVPDNRKILALDLASKTGWAYGPAGTIKRSGTVNLRPSSQDTYEQAWINAGHFLRQFFILDKPDVVVCEAAIPPGQGGGGNNVLIAWGCLAVVRFVCHAYSIPVRYANVGQVRVHYLGSRSQEPPADFKPNLKDKRERKRQWTKLAVVRRAHKLGHMPYTSDDDNQADACSIHSFASVVWYRVAPTEIYMLGEMA